IHTPSQPVVSAWRAVASSSDQGWKAVGQTERRIPSACTLAAGVTAASYGPGMRTAVSLPPFTDPDTLVAMATEAGEAGWDGVFLWDHVVLFPELGLDVHNPWVVLGAMAQAT